MTTFDRFQWYNAWIDDPRVTDELISVLAVLFRYINAHGTCYPSQVMISDHLQKAVRTVQRRLLAIESLGYIERSGGYTVYRARIPALKTGDTHVAYTVEQATPMSPNTTPMSPNTTPMSPNTTPMSPNTTPMSPMPEEGDTHVAYTVEQATPMSPNTTPMTPQHDTHVALTDQEQTKEQTSSSSSCKNGSEVLKKPKTENPPPPPPAETLLGFCKQAEIEITIFQAESLWAQVRSQLIEHDEQDVWDYFRWKLSDLTGTEFSTRVKLRFLTQDVSTWLDQKRKQNVGRNDFPASTAIPNEPMVEPEPQVSTAPTVSTDAAQHAQQVWEIALNALQTAVSRKNYTDWIAPLTPIGIEQTTLHLDAGDGFKAVYIEDTYRTLILDTLTAAGAEVDSLKLHPEFSI